MSRSQGLRQRSRCVGTALAAVRADACSPGAHSARRRAPAPTPSPSPAAASSLASVGTAAFAVTLGSGTVTTAATNLNSGNYADTTGSGAGWNGTLALQQFVNTQAWVPTGTALNANTSGGVHRHDQLTPTTR